MIVVCLGQQLICLIMVSVIIPVYNCKSYLQQAVKSVISQPYQAISVILVDDGSTDGSSLLCDELAVRDDYVAF